MPRAAPSTTQAERGPLLGNRDFRGSFRKGVCLATWALSVFVASGVGLLWLVMSQGVGKCRYDCTPYDVHLALTGDSTEMRVTWRTKSEGCASLVLYTRSQPEASLAQNAWWRLGIFVPKAYGSDNRYVSDDFCGAPANETEFELNIHSAILSNLEPGAPYRYTIWTGCEEWEFSAAALPGGREDFTFVAFGDLGDPSDRRSPGAGGVIDSLKTELVETDPKMVVLVGDVSYGSGDADLWNNFMASIEPVAARVPWMVANGNHEYDLTHGQTLDPWGIKPYMPEWGIKEFGTNDGGGECGLQYYWRFPMLARNFEKPFAEDQGGLFGRWKMRRALQDEKEPEIRPLDDSGAVIAPNFGVAFPPFWYAFEYGGVHFIVLSSEHDISEGSAQMAWLISDLESVDRCRTPFVLAFFHRAIRAPVWIDDYPVQDHVLPQLKQPLLRGKLDALIVGHVHLYYRVCAFDADGCEDNQGLYQITLGTGGRKQDHVPDEYSDKYLRTFGFGRFSVSNNASKMLFEFVGSESRTVLDSMKLKSKGIC